MNNRDPLKKHWTIVYVLVPVVVALIAVLGNFFSSQTKTKSSTDVGKIETGPLETTGDASPIQIGEGTFENNNVIKKIDSDKQNTDD